MDNIKLPLADGEVGQEKRVIPLMTKQHYGVLSTLFVKPMGREYSALSDEQKAVFDSILGKFMKLASEDNHRFLGNLFLKQIGIE